MTTKFMAGLCIACSATMITGCIDKNYDLADVDCTTRIPVDNVTLPLNIDPVQFGDVLKPEGKIRIVSVEGKSYYAFVEEGDFGTNTNVSIGTFNVKAPMINPSHKDLQPVSSPSGSRPQAPSLPSFSLKSGDVTSFDYIINDVPKELIRLDYIKAETPFKYKMTLTFPQLSSLSGSIKDFTLRDVKIQLPKGLDAIVPYGSYSLNTGIWTIPSVTIGREAAELTLTAKGINTSPDYAAANINADHSMDLHGDFDIIDGVVILNPTANPNLSEIPASLVLDINYSIESFVVKYISGAINYNLQGLDIDPVSLSDIPDILKGDQTVLHLANPQLYFQVNNPLSQYDAKGIIGLNIGAVRDQYVRKFSPSEDIVITNQHGSGPYSYTLAVNDKNLSYPDGDIDYRLNNTFISFPTLGDLMAPDNGDTQAGLPKKIEINIVDPRISSNKIVDFELGKTYGEVKGNYILVAPLALTGDSRILYEKTYSGWNDDSLNDLSITELSMTADYINAAPVSMTLHIYPLDKDGKPYGIGNEALISSSSIAAGLSGEFTINLTSDTKITGLDGMRLYLELDNPDGETLSPDQTLSLENIRITVSGYYETDFK